MGCPAGKERVEKILMEGRDEALRGACRKAAKAAVEVRACAPARPPLAGCHGGTGAAAMRSAAGWHAPLPACAPCVRSATLHLPVIPKQKLAAPPPPGARIHSRRHLPASPVRRCAPAVRCPPAGRGVGGEAGRGRRVAGGRGRPAASAQRRRAFAGQRTPAAGCVPGDGHAPAWQQLGPPGPVRGPGEGPAA
jgi:hypothetical protein